MKKKVKRIFLIIIIVLLFAIFALFSFLAISYIKADRVAFDTNKITSSSLSIEIFDSLNRPMPDDNDFNGKYVKLEVLPDYVKKAFISIEDKDFYSHNGINPKRMVKATLKNIATFRFKEGASTISQQLIKNTHLTNEKKLTRKINEIVLAKKLEKNFSKEQIMEAYLNVIYFGDNCYGIESASNHYFNKPAKDLNVNDSCILAGLIKAPNRYHPINNPSNCITRKNLVLKEMLKDNYINENTYIKYKNDKLNLNINREVKNKLNSYSEYAIDEAINILKMPKKQIAIAGYRIFTFCDLEKQVALENSLAKINKTSSYACISINPQKSTVEAYIGYSNMKLSSVKRQPASAIKPVLVYAPAINENVISPYTQLLDEEINIAGYKPKNVGNSYSGYVSASTALAKSLNVPAVKVTTYTGLDKCMYYAKKCGIEFNNKDNNLSIALGGMTDGLTLKNLTSSYIPLANNGIYENSSFVSHIADKNGKIIYIRPDVKTTVFRDDTAFLVTQMLLNTKKEGTAKKLGELNYDIASKTGTVGSSNGNFDAYNISYTSRDLVGVWAGNLDNSKIDTVGGGKPTEIVKNYYNTIYKSSAPENFEVPSSVSEEEIDMLTLNNEHLIVKADNFLPERYKTKGYFSKFNLPSSGSQKYLNLQPTQINGKVKNGDALITFEAVDYYSYELYKIENGKEECVRVYYNKSGEIQEKIPIKSNKIVQFYLITKIKNYADNRELSSDKSNIIELINVNGDSKINNKTDNKKWYI